MICSLDKLPKGSIAHIVSFSDLDLELKLMEFGYISGSLIKVIEKTINGDPVIIENASTKLVLRKSEISKIQVETK
jgi:Fe2+ transport system protein FeoA